jgi:hypothetical protein
MSSAGNSLAEVVRYEERCINRSITHNLVLPTICHSYGWFINARSGYADSV